MNAARLAPVPPVVAATPAVAPPSAADRPAAPGAPAHPFAELLRQNQRAEARTATRAGGDLPHAPKPSAEPSTGGDDQEAAPVAADGSKRNEATRARARSAGAAKPATKPGAATSPLEDSGPADGRSNGAREPASPGGPADPASAVAHRPADAARPPVLAADASASSGPDPAAAARTLSMAAGDPHEADASTGAEDDGVGDAVGSTHGRAARAGHARPGGARTEAVRSDASRADAASRRDATAAADRQATTGGPFAAALIERVRPDGASAAPGLQGATATASAGASGPSEPRAADPAPASATIPVPVDAPQFPAAIGVQVSVFAKDGVQHAELHLNPAEMGPVSVAITLDGTQARVDFGADLAVTRQALEAGLPALAGALQEAGFTLSGGGVSQHAAGGGQASADDARSGERAGGDGPFRSAASAPIDPAGVRTTRRIAAGGVDLYA